MPPPGGDVIGRRRLDPHLDAFRALGADVSSDGRSYRIDAPRGGLRACDFFMDEPSVMATENALMAAALTPGSTVIHNAASEPHVQDLARLLLQMGARIEGIGSNVLIVHGQELARRRRLRDRPRLHRDRLASSRWPPAPAASCASRTCVADDLRMTRLAFERLGCRIEFDGDDVVVPGGQTPAHPATTRATRSPRSRTGPGPPSRPT